jgi:hypothetical protein
MVSFVDLHPIFNFILGVQATVAFLNFAFGALENGTML